jgi:hypothetical protein
MINVQQTMIVGVGPIGRQFIEQLKTRITKYYGEEGLPSIKLMAIDVLQPQGEFTSGAAADEAIETNLSPTEHIEIPMDDLAPSPAKYHEMFQWLPDELTGSETDWWVTRAAVKLALHLNYRSLVDFLSHHFNLLGGVDVATSMADKGFDVLSDRNEATMIMVGGLGDVTGSALLLDITYMLQYIYRRAGLQIASTALCFMPATVPQDDNAEAIAYATLKEINEAMEKQTYSTHFRSLQDRFNNAPFNHGCYLLEMNTEKQARLRDMQETIYLTAEWLFRVLLSPLKGYIDQFVAGQGLVQHIQNQPAVFSGLGMASFLLPVDDLIEWCANQLGADLLQGQVLGAETFDKVQDRLVTFYNQKKLKPDDLRRTKLGVGKTGKEMEREEGIQEQIQGLQQVPYDQMLPRFQQTLQSVKAKLPALGVQVQQNAKRVLQEFREGLRTEINEIMRAFPAGGLSLATQFTDQLQIEFNRFAGVLKRREAAVRAKNGYLSQKLKNYGLTLENAVKGIPGMLPLGISILGLVILLVMASVWLWPNPGESTVTLVYALVVLLFTGLGVFYAISQTKKAVNDARSNYIEELKLRWRNEISLLLIHEASTLYPDLVQEASTQNRELRAFGDEMHALARGMVSNLSTDHMIGDLGFPLQKSVLSDEIIEKIYHRQLGIGGSAAQLTNLLQVLGSPDSWRKKDPGVIARKIIEFGRQQFKPLEKLTAEEIFWEQFPEIGKAEVRVRILRDLAYPLWLYDTWPLGQESPPLAETYLALHQPDTSKLVPRFRGIEPEIKVQAMNELHGVFVMTVRRGLPLFALNRMEQFQKHYLNWIMEELPPIHLDDDSALVRDLMDNTSTDETYEAAIAFSLGEALGMVAKDTEGTYRVRLEKKSKKLTKSPVSSQIMLGLDIEFLKSMTAEIKYKVDEAGSTIMADNLEAYLVEPQVTIPDWQRRRIESFVSNVLKG